MVQPVDRPLPDPGVATRWASIDTLRRAATESLDSIRVREAQNGKSLRDWPCLSESTRRVLQITPTRWL